MGVMACSRQECESVMCDRYSHEYGYICNSCFEELVAAGAQVNIHSFMSRHGLPDPVSSARAIFEAEFPSIS